MGTAVSPLLIWWVADGAYGVGLCVFCVQRGTANVSLIDDV